MNSVEVTIAGEALTLFAEKALFWRRVGTLLAADTHFGKAAAFRHAGIAVPEQVTTIDLQRLTLLIKETRAQRLVVIGDLFHARTGQSKATLDAFHLWRTQHDELRIELLEGNHDVAVGALPELWRIRVLKELREPPFLMTHKESKAPRLYSLCGHVHPSVSCAGMRLPCFHFTASSGLLPAFGSFTGTHTVYPARGDRVFAVSDGEIMDISGAVSVR